VSLPVIVILGRPNVGKSTLFNRLTRSRRALVHDQPGVTRDRIIGEAERPDGGLVTVIDTGGLLLEDKGSDRFIPLIRSQAEAALRDADAVLFLVDGGVGPIPEDREISGYLRSLEVPVVLAVNKDDRRGVDLQAQEFHSLGLGEPVAISAEHGTGLEQLWMQLEPLLGEPVGAADEEPRPQEIQVAIVGRPNVGKSSLLNRLVGESRALVSEIPGTTRDAVDVMIEKDQQQYRFVDIAGIRRKGRTDRGPEVLSVVMARRHVERADLALVLVDAAEGVTRQDAHVAGYAWDAGRAVALVVNKCDLMQNREQERRHLDYQIDQNLKFMRHAPRAFVSALTGKGVSKLFPLMAQLDAAYRTRITTSELNQILKQAWDSRPPSVPGKTAPKLFYASQVHHAPPSFVLFTNLTRDLHFSYLRHLENVLRKSLHLAGVPIRVMIRGRKC
jgi:GTP-binding protein